MKFKVYRASKTGFSIMEFNTLEELAEFGRTVNESLLIQFPFVTSNNWMHDDPDETGEITIYDSYIE